MCSVEAIYHRKLSSGKVEKKKSAMKESGCHHSHILGSDLVLLIDTQPDIMCPLLCLNMDYTIKPTICSRQIQLTGIYSLDITFILYEKQKMEEQAEQYYMEAVRQIWGG